MIIIIMMTTVIKKMWMMVIIINNVSLCKTQSPLLFILSGILELHRIPERQFNTIERNVKQQKVISGVLKSGRA